MTNVYQHDTLRLLMYNIAVADRPHEPNLAVRSLDGERSGCQGAGGKSMSRDMQRATGPRFQIAAAPLANRNCLPDHTNFIMCAAVACAYRAIVRLRHVQ